MASGSAFAACPNHSVDSLVVGGVRRREPQKPVRREHHPPPDAAVRSSSRRHQALSASEICSSRWVHSTACPARTPFCSRSAAAKGLWRGAGERFFRIRSIAASKTNNNNGLFFPATMAASAIFGLLRPSTRISRGHAPPHGQTPSGPHTAAHRLAPPSALQHGPRPMDATAWLGPTAWRRGRFILTRHGRARRPCDSA